MVEMVELGTAQLLVVGLRVVLQELLAIQDRELRGQMVLTVQ
jgi:hypothetical protein